MKGARNSRETKTELPRMPTSPIVTAQELGLTGTGSWPLHGTLPPFPRLAVVGSRAASRAALACVPALVAAAGARGHALVSGGARGVDGAMHRAALAAGLPQLAIVPCTPGDPYPPEHAALFAAIAAAPGSGVMFTRPEGLHNTRGIFASRNRIVVGVASALVVVQALPRSGSWGTGRMALRDGRRTAAVLGPAGCADLIAHGATALPCEPGTIGAAVLRWLDAGPGGPGGPGSMANPTWPEDLRWLGDLLASAGPRGLGLDDLAEETTAANANAALLSAELLGLVLESPQGRYHLRR